MRGFWTLIYEDYCADEIHHNPMLSAFLGKEALASQPTLSRFFNRMDDDTFRQFDDTMRAVATEKDIFIVATPYIEKRCKNN